MIISPELSRSMNVSRERASMVRIALIATAVLDLIAAALFQSQTWLLERMRNGEHFTMAEANANDDRINLVVRISVVLLVITGILFLRWFHRALAVAKELNGALTRSPGEAIAAFFIPVANFFAPCAVMLDLRRAVEPGDLPLVRSVDPVGAPAYRGAPVGSSAALPAAPVGWWWGAYVGMIVAGLVSSALRSQSLPSLIAMSGCATVARVLGVVAAVLAIFVVRGVEARANERARRLAGMEEVEAGA